MGNDGISKTLILFYTNVQISAITFYSTEQLVDREFFHDEIWVKIGGDKGGRPTSSMKMCYQICNVTAPNSRENTVCFLVYEGNDSLVNLKAILTQYQNQVSNLQQATWRYCKGKQ